MRKMLKMLFMKYLFMLYIYISLIGFQSSFLCSNQIKRMEKDCFDYIDKYYSYSRFNPLKKWHETFILFSHLQCFFYSFIIYQLIVHLFVEFVLSILVKR